jgi:hypothetical protein
MFVHSCKINKDHFRLTTQFHHTVICIHILRRLALCAKFLKLQYGRIQDEHTLVTVFHWVTLYPAVLLCGNILPNKIVSISVPYLYHFVVVIIFVLC